MKRVIALIATAAVAAAVAIPAFGATRTINVDDNRFSPRSVTVKRGTTLRFRWVGDNPHNVRGAGINIGIRTSGTRTARARRSGRLVCTVHPGMTMRLRVTR